MATSGSGGRGGPATLEDVARLAGVSRATASRVVRGDTTVSPKRERAVRAAIKELRYVPNLAARQLVTRRSNVLAIIVPEPDWRVFSDPFFARTVQGVTRAATGLDFRVVMVFDDPAQQVRPGASFLSEGRADAAIIVSHHQIPGHMEALLGVPVPVVFIGKPQAGDDAGVPWVDADNRGAGRIAAARLLERGVRRPAIVTGAMDMVAAQDRLAGFRAVFDGQGTQVRIFEGAFTRASGTAAGQALVGLVRDGEVDGVFSSSDLMSAGVVEALAADGIRVGRDVPLVSMDDSDFAHEVDPPLTTITNPVEQMTEHATDMVARLLAGESAGEPVVVPVELVERQSG